ncbi:MAG: hypothetical protein ABW080_06155 [Candidatus Thiodiazotropha sp.]
MTGNAEDVCIAKGSSKAGVPVEGTRYDQRLEPAFLDFDRGTLFPRDLSHPVKTQRHLAYLIRRRPKTLRLHVERILLLHESKNPHILGALWDLFLVLGDAGQPLRRRMLLLAKPLLPTDVYQVLNQHIEKQSDIHAAWLTLLEGSAVLHQGMTGTTRLIHKTESRDAETVNPFEVAQEALACGQTDLAQKTLEQALLADSKRLDIHLRLLEIHRHLRDLSQVRQFRAKLQGQDNPAENEWIRLQKMLEEEAEKR